MKVVLLCAEGSSSAIVYNFISRRYDIDDVICVDGDGLRTFLKRRVRKYGLRITSGQILFRGIAVPLLKREARNRRNAILEEYGLDESKAYLDERICKRVPNVNCKECEGLLREINPDVVIVNGTSIIKKNILSCCNAVFINMHAGITPKYRGCHGGYWALFNGDEENAGVTVHLVDEGIDTGNILYQASINVTDEDNFTTYPLLQTAEGVRLEVRALQDAEKDSLRPKESELPSGLYAHPTLLQYIKKRIRCGVK